MLMFERTVSDVYVCDNILIGDIQSASDYCIHAGSQARTHGVAEERLATSGQYYVLNMFLHSQIQWGCNRVQNLYMGGDSAPLAPKFSAADWLYIPSAMMNMIRRRWWSFCSLCNRLSRRDEKGMNKNTIVKCYWHLFQYHLTFQGSISAFRASSNHLNVHWI